MAELFYYSESISFLLLSGNGFKMGMKATYFTDVSYEYFTNVERVKYIYKAINR